MAGEKILVIDHQVETIDLIHQHLELDGFKVTSTDNAKDAFILFDATKPDLIILDTNLTDMDGITVCIELRKVTSVPIIFISTKHDEMDKILALGVGGDDYLTKPFSTRELAARVKAHLRRNVSLYVLPPDKNSLSVSHKDLEIDPSTHTVLVNKKRINLSSKEFKLLYLFASNPNRIYNNDQLFNLIWETDSMGDTRTVMVHISNLRRKIEIDPTNPKFVTTIRGVGYKFVG